jgi:hypothetical protein
MQIIGCDLHARQQSVAMLDTLTGEVVNRTFMHEGHSVREFYSALPGPVRVGIEATGSMKWFVHLMEDSESTVRSVIRRRFERPDPADSVCGTPRIPAPPAPPGSTETTKFTCRQCCAKIQREKNIRSRPTSNGLVLAALDVVCGVNRSPN